jgi:hypothetical protein
MKKFLLPIILSAGLGTCAVSHADGWHHGGGHYVYRPGFGWVVPAVVGGVIGYEISRPVQPNVVVVQPQPVYPAPQVVPPQAPVGFHWEAILDANCNCYRTVMVQN